VTKKWMMGLGFGVSLMVAAAFAADKAASAPEKEAKQAEISVGDKSHCMKGQKSAGAQCLRKSGSAKAKTSGDQSMASSEMDCSKSADCPKADCDKEDCLKHSAAKAGKGADCMKPAGAETEI
jgi:hypothetical protein